MKQAQIMKGTGIEKQADTRILKNNNSKESSGMDTKHTEWKHSFPEDIKKSAGREIHPYQRVPQESTLKQLFGSQ